MPYYLISELGILFCFIVFLGVIVWKLSGWKTKIDVTMTEQIPELKKRVKEGFEEINNRFEEINNRFEEINNRFEEINNRFEEINNRFEQVTRRFEDVARRFEQVTTRIDNLSRRIDFLSLPKTTEAQSPIKLNDLGKKISTEHEVRKWVESAHGQSLIEELVKSGVEEEYEIFENCYNYVRNLDETDGDFRRKTSAAAYNSGTSQPEVLKVYQIELRDWVLKRLNQAPSP